MSSDVRVLGPGDVAPMRAMLAKFGAAFDAYLERLLASETTRATGCRDIDSRPPPRRLH